MEYPIKCHSCAKTLYGPVKYCPFCGVASASVILADRPQEPPKQPETTAPPLDAEADQEEEHIRREKLEQERRANGERQILDALEAEVRGGIFNPDKASNLIHMGNSSGLSSRDAGEIILRWLAERGYRPVKPLPSNLAPEGKIQCTWILPGNLTLRVVASSNTVRIGRSIKIRAEASGFETDALEFQWKADIGTIKGTGPEVWLDSAGVFLSQSSQPCSVSVKVQDSVGQSATGQTEIKIQKQAIAARVAIIGFAVICAVILAMVLLMPKQEVVTPVVKLLPSADSVNLGGSIKIGTETSGFDAGSKEFRWKAELGAIKGSGAQVWLDTSSIRFPQSSRVCLVTLEVLDKFGHSAQNNTAVKIVNESSIPLVKITAANESIRRNESVKIAAKTLGFDLSSQVLAWRSDIGNIIGRGAEIELNTAGIPPTISSINVTLEVHDKLDHSGRDTIKIKLLPGSSPSPQPRATQAVLDPSLHDWFDHVTGKPLLWYFKDYDGNLHFFDGPGYAPATGDELKPVTPDIRHSGENRDKASNQPTGQPSQRGVTSSGTKDSGLSPPPKPPIASQQLGITSFEAVPSPMDPCKFAILRWTVSGATDVFITPGVGPVKRLSGYTVVVRPPQSTRYMLEAKGIDGKSIRREATLGVTKGEAGCPK